MISPYTDTAVALALAADGRLDRDAGKPLAPKPKKGETLEDIRAASDAAVAAAQPARRPGRPPGSRDKRPRRPRFAPPDAEPKQHPTPQQRAEINSRLRREEPRVPEQYAFKVKQWADALGLGISTVQALVKAKEIQ